MGRSLKENRRNAVARGGEVGSRKKPREESSTIAHNNSIFSPDFQKRHLREIPGTLSSKQKRQFKEDAIKAMDERMRQEAFKSSVPSPHPNTLIGMSTATRKYLEGFARNPRIQNQLANGNPVRLDLPPKGIEGIQHRTYAVTANRGTEGISTITHHQPTDIKNKQPAYMTVRGQRITSPDGRNTYSEIHHLEPFEQS